ncbi:TPA: effector protein, partial [Yersinia enterocolitica]|nr:effector protein [Yersinia enterocolitica]HDL6787629.1 effector protein [Yersinia enterocolitica]
LDVRDNQLIELPALPPHLERLIASLNHLAEVPELPQNLKQLHVEHNALREFPDIPESVEDLRMDSERVIDPYEFAHETIDKLEDDVFE